MSRTSSGGRMKTLRCSSSPDKKTVLMSPDTNSHLFDATHCKISASDCAESAKAVSGNLCQVWAVTSQDADACLDSASRHPRQHPSSSHHSILVGNLLFHGVEHIVIQPRLQLCLFCSAKEHLVLFRHLVLASLHHPSLRRSPARPCRFHRSRSLGRLGFR